MLRVLKPAGTFGSRPRIWRKDLEELPHGKLLQSPAGYFILVVDKAHLDHQTR